MKSKLVWIYDLEQFRNFHSATFYCIQTNEYRQFVICPFRNDLLKYYTFLTEEVDGLIGFNNLEFDYPLLHYILTQATDWIIWEIDVNDIIEELYNETQKIINATYSRIPEWKVLIRQLDLRLIHHFDNAAKMANLKQIGIAMDFPNIEDLPFLPDYVIQESDIPTILDYNKNDVMITTMLFNLSKGITDHPLYKGNDMIKLRMDIGEKYSMSCDNYNDVKIGEEINKLIYIKNSGLKFQDFKYLRTNRESIALSDCISSDIVFKTEQLQKFLEELKTIVVVGKKNAFERNIIIGNKRFNFKLGGIHSDDSGLILRPKDGQLLREVDVASMYPRTIINDHLYPAHLGVEWLMGYKEIYDERIKAKHAGNKLVANTLKLSLNGGGFGKTGAPTSWMYDPLVSMSVTIRGQLRQLMLIEDFSIAGLQLISANTDGIVVLTTGDDENNIFKRICKEWEVTTGYELEETLYNLLVMRDVNNYLAIKQDGKIKLKGVFEINKELHKNHSMRIVRKALVKFYSENIPVETTIYESKDIKDFLLAVKFRGSHGIVKGIKNNEWVEEYYKKNFRYFISNGGQPLLKIFDKGDRETRVNVGYLITPFNKFYDVKDFSEYDVNYNFYIEECNKVIRAVNTVVPLQLELNL